MNIDALRIFYSTHFQLRIGVRGGIKYGDMNGNGDSKSADSSKDGVSWLEITAMVLAFAAFAPVAVWLYGALVQSQQLRDAGLFSALHGRSPSGAALVGQAIAISCSIVRCSSRAWSVWAAV